MYIIIQIYYTEIVVQKDKELLKTTQVKGLITYKEMAIRLKDDLTAQMKLKDNTTSKCLEKTTTNLNANGIP